MLEVELRVHWKHLSLSSEMFAEATPRADSKDDRTISLLQADVVSMQLLLNIIPRRTRSVHRQVDLYTLKQVVILIDSMSSTRLLRLSRTCGSNLFGCQSFLAARAQLKVRS